MTPEEYKQKLARAEELGALDPEPNSPEGQALIALADELEQYERVHFLVDDMKTLIADLRGGTPEACDFCKQKTQAEQLEPEEAGQWVCWYCLRDWAYEDDNRQEAAFWERAIKELECRRTT